MLFTTKVVTKSSSPKDRFWNHSEKKSLSTLCLFKWLMEWSWIIINIVRGQWPKRSISKWLRHCRVSSGSVWTSSCLQFRPDISDHRSRNFYLLSSSDRLFLELSDVVTQSPEVYWLITYILSKYSLNSRDRRINIGWPVIRVYHSIFGVSFHNGKVDQNKNIMGKRTREIYRYWDNFIYFTQEIVMYL